MHKDWELGIGHWEGGIGKGELGIIFLVFNVLIVLLSKKNRTLDW